ncbi:hypothetical protein C0J52_25310, partial [Blattella germanica]
IDFLLKKQYAFHILSQLATIICKTPAISFKNYNSAIDFLIQKQYAFDISRYFINFLNAEERVDTYLKKKINIITLTLTEKAIKAKYYNYFRK